MREFKQCKNGHYYQGEHCPYCYPNQAINSLLVTYPDDYTPPVTKGSKVCPSGHCYIDYDKCPYCGEERVIGSADMHTGQGYSIIGRSGEQALKIIIDDKEIWCVDIKIGYWVWNWANRYKSNYCIMNGNENLYVYANSSVEFGVTLMTGKEFIKMCDIIIDNRLTLIGT